MTSLICSTCGAHVGDDAHTPHDPGCDRPDEGCSCDTRTYCAGCCPECADAGEQLSLIGGAS